MTRGEKMFWNQIDKTGSCWLWTGQVRGKEGYGRNHWPKTDSKPHNTVYELLIGEIPKDKVVCHTCRNPKCVNPDHMYLDLLSDSKKDTIQRKKEYKAKWFSENKERLALVAVKPDALRKASWQIKYKYNLSYDEYTKRLEEANGKCCICGEIPKDGKRLCVDHNHTTNQIRDLICKHCNWVIGHSKESIDILNNTIAYLNKWNEN